MKPNVPPYVSFSTFEKELEKLAKEDSVESITADSFPDCAASTRAQLMQAFRYLDFVDELGKPTERFDRYVQFRQNLSKKAEVLADALRDRCPEHVEFIEKGTLEEYQDSFDEYGLDDSVQRRCEKFLLKAADRAKLSISGAIIGGMVDGRRARGRRLPGYVDVSVTRASSGGKMVTIPVPLAADRVWSVRIDADYEEKDLDKFFAILKLALAK